jgi:histidine kinase
MRRHRPTLLALAMLVLGALLAMATGWHLARRATLQEEHAIAARQLLLYQRGLLQHIERYRTLPQLLALDGELRDALQGPLDAAARQSLNLKLERANGITRSSTLTLIGRDGVALAASNWREASSNVGEDYSFRPYVIQALRVGHGRFFGIGLTTGQPGYFISEAVRDARGEPLGVVVIKVDMSALEREWPKAGDIVLVTDRHGVAFLAGREAWRYRTLAPLDARERGELARARQYAQQPLSPIRTQSTGEANGAPLLRVLDPPAPQPMLWVSAPVPDTGWRLHLLHDVGTAVTAARIAALAAGGAWLALGFLALFVLQRRRLSALRQRSRAELEALVQQHARELRSAQDGLVQAAQSAEAGLSRSLAHLPQGVVIIDADLRLVAWNARYAELFGFPAELLRIGRPIADLFRYNAQRGLLGPGPVDEAIQRRLDYLRSGQPHQRESEKDDGTVLEIRGNPLPDGGFVTSYTDITSYKNAARELRSLADALEHRIEERTHALAAATRAAEQANRYKTRFVAAAVHDLLQPLNAARMFLSALRGKLAEPGARQVADHVEQALVAQDAILQSLLDISRLEAGTLQTRVRDFALEPLLDTLGREFGILAAARGLDLRRVPTRAVVRSDEALLRRILQNFLSNAVRYTPAGRIVLGCRRTETGLRIEVHDQGPGIPDSQRGVIFEEFRRLDDGVANDRGAGLGLAIVERIGRVLGHPIGLRSRLGRGSMFAVTVPWGDALAAAQERAPSAPAETDGDASLLQGLRIWCVDDDPRVREATRTLLQRWRCEVVLAADGDEALAAAGPGNAPDLLLLDVRMQPIDGPTLHPLLCERWGAHPPTLLLTAERDDALRELAQARGWGFLHKPVRAAALRALMTQLLLRRAG